MAWRKNQRIPVQGHGHRTEVDVETYARIANLAFGKESLVVTWDVYATREAWETGAQAMGQVRMRILPDAQPETEEVLDPETEEVLVPAAGALPSFAELMQAESGLGAPWGVLMADIRRGLYELSKNMPEWADAVKDGEGEGDTE